MHVEVLLHIQVYANNKWTFLTTLAFSSSAAANSLTIKSSGLFES